MIPRLYLTAGLTAAALVVGLWTGWKLAASSYKSDIIKAQQEVAAAIAKAAKQANQHAEELEKARAEREIIYRTITKRVDKIIDRPVYRNVCLDDDGLHAINDAITGKTADSGKPDAAVPETGSAGR